MLIKTCALLTINARLGLYYLSLPILEKYLVILSLIFIYAPVSYIYFIIVCHLLCLIVWLMFCIYAYYHLPDDLN